MLETKSCVTREEVLGPPGMSSMDENN